MTSFKEYLKLSGLSEQEAVSASRDMRDWHDLHAWMDRNQEPLIQPVPNRLSITSPAIKISWKDNIREGVARVAAPRVAVGWERVVAHRQKVTLVLTLASTAVILTISSYALRAQQMPENMLLLYLVVYGVMTFFLTSNFYKLMLGSWHMLRGPSGNPWHPSKTSRDPKPGTRVAILFPVYHEDVGRVAAGIAATWSSIKEQHPEFADLFDMFLLSDSRKIEYWIAEQAAVHRLIDNFPDGRFFYRRRPSNTNAKLGNMVDFCRRWGKDYDYMVVMDADSVMDGDAVVSIVRMMEGNERLGILQTNPKPVFRESLFGRMQQFGARLYGSVFSYGLQAMYMGNASYIGHNAIIRVKPFIDHCILPELSGRKPWGGKPLSHDIVESAMMARAGYEVWFLPEIVGSYEEMPANLLGFLVRERRWMQGNLQHLRFIFLNGLRPVHRETFLNGSMGYLAAPLWAIFLFVSAYGMVHFLQHGVLALGDLRTLELPMTMLLISSLVFLFMPRFLAVGVNIAQDKARGFGGKDKLLWSVLLETLFSFFFSPIMMIFITRFLWLWVKRKGISWGTQQRDDSPLPWVDCFRQFGWLSILGLACWTALLVAIWNVPAGQAALMETFSGGWLRPSDLLIWFSPILGGFLGSVWIARATSRTFPSLRARRLFSIPEEFHTPRVLRETLEWNSRFRELLPNCENHAETVSYAVGSPQFYARHRQETKIRPHVAKWLLPKISAKSALTDQELMLALGERNCFDAIHVAHANSMK